MICLLQTEELGHQLRQLVGIILQIHDTEELEHKLGQQIELSIGMRKLNHQVH